MKERLVKEITRFIKDGNGFVIVRLRADQDDYCKDCCMVKDCKITLQSGEECIEKEVE